MFVHNTGRRAGLYGGGEFACSFARVLTEREGKKVVSGQERKKFAQWQAQGQARGKNHTHTHSPRPTYHLVRPLPLVLDYLAY